MLENILLVQHCLKYSYLLYDNVRAEKFSPGILFGALKPKCWRDGGNHFIKGEFMNTIQIHVSKLSESIVASNFKKIGLELRPLDRGYNHSNRVLGIRIGLVTSHRGVYLNSSLFIWKFPSSEYECS